ncbi:bacillithiol biosynthesis cysteine-adding enzyme BshC, partial [bacterium]|nr:bacillithiol biosynthesis cysteine-adding enzyme BshC [bacterium]MBU1651404.1 bacillithiol biosynthesis cysteine-adding enzyme BshC [bacterium]
MARSWEFSRLPGLNPLFLKYVEDFDAVSSFFAVDYRGLHGKWEGLDTVSNQVKPDLVEGLLADAERWRCKRKAIENIEALRDPDTVAVLTGQQVGLFGGPLFAFYKALSAILWAQEIEASTGRRAVPVFWMETTDHDFFEVNHARLLNLDGDEENLSLVNSPAEKRRIVGSIKLNGEIEQVLRRLYHILPNNTYRGAYLEVLDTCYRPETTFGDAFAQLFSHLFGEDGLILYDANNSQCKKATSALVQRILSSTSELNNLLAQATTDVTSQGFPAQIQMQADKMQLFYAEDGIRYPITADGNILYEKKQQDRAGIEKLKQIAAEHPDRFLPKVSLRPIFQDYLFPTAAYLAGPSEIAYFSQLKPLYNHLDVRMPAIIPRLSLTLIEAKIKKILDRQHFTPEQLRRGPQALITDYLDTDPGNDLVGLFAEARKMWEDLHDHLTYGLIQIDP